MINLKSIKIKPIEQSETLPSNFYTDLSIFEIEKEKIFSKSWQLVGAESRIPNSGDTWAITIAENPIIITRQKNNTIKAFYNVCQHRGGSLVREDCNTKSFQCNYHGWMYNLDGTLRKTREFDGVENFDQNQYGLVSIHLDIWMGQIFVNLSENPKPLNKHLDGIQKRISPINFSSYKFHLRESYSINCNWKVYMDNFLEGYHIPFVHPKLNKVMDYKAYKTELFDNFSLQWCPLDSELSPYGKTDLEVDKAFYFTIFPNILLNIAPGRIQTNIIEPTSSTTCKVHFDYHFEHPEKTDIIGDLNFSELVQQEDIQICEEVQKGLASKGYEKGRFSVKSETGVHHFQSLIIQAVFHG